MPFGRGFWRGRGWGFGGGFGRRFRGGWGNPYGFGMGAPGLPVARGAVVWGAPFAPPMPRVWARRPYGPYGSAYLYGSGYPYGLYCRWPGV